MQLEDVLRCIQEGEGQRVEFKESFAQSRPAIESLCAMANAEGGVVLFGVRDDGSVVGVQLGKKTLEDFSNQIRRNTQPLPLHTIDRYEIDGKNVVAVKVLPAPVGTVYRAYNITYYRSGKTNQSMPPGEMGRKTMAGFRPVVMSSRRSKRKGDQSWQDREQERVAIYARNRGLFLVHRWQPSSTPGQLADIQIELRQHNQGPLTEGTIKCVEYHLGPRFASRTIVQSNRDENFRLEVSAYGPFLCLARVRFDDGSDPVDLERYIDF